MKKKWMIYGEKGYEGELIDREDVRRGIKKVMERRKRKEVEELEEEIGIEFWSLGLENKEIE